MLVTLFQTTLSCVVAEPNQIAVCIGHLSWDADLVAVEVVGLLAAFADRVSIGETAHVRLHRSWKYH